LLSCWTLTTVHRNVGNYSPNGTASQDGRPGLRPRRCVSTKLAMRILLGPPFLVSAYTYGVLKLPSIWDAFQFRKLTNAARSLYEAPFLNERKSKGKVTPLRARLWPRVGYSFTLPRPRRLNGVSGQQHAPAALYPRERPGTHCTGGWVGPRAGLDGRKISPPPGFDPRTVQARSQSLYLLSYPAHSKCMY
jgi:hypothetical protein